jgi:hypothetical protein
MRREDVYAAILLAGLIGILSALVVALYLMIA